MIDRAGDETEGRDEQARRMPLKAIATAPGRYAGALWAGVKRRLSEPDRRGSTLLMLTLAVLVIVTFGYVMALMLRVPPVDDLANARKSQATVLFSADGVQLARFYRQNRTWVSLDSIAPVTVRALIDTEDRRFYDHWGIDVMRTFGAILRTVGGDKQGGSTITMQLVRNAYPEIADDFVLTRKIEEWLTALQIERRYTKDEILEIYLNTVPFNYNAFGIEAAARTYFNKSAYQLDTLESALLVGMLKGTTLYNPVRNPEASLERRNVVLQQMVEAGTISEDEYEGLSRHGLNLDFEPLTSEKNRAPYFAEYVRQWLSDWGKQNGYDIYDDGLRVHTTIDAGMQLHAEAAVAGVLDELQDVVDVSWSQSRMPIVSGNPEAYRAYRDRIEPFAYYWESNPDALRSFIRQTERYRALKDAGRGEDEAIDALRQDTAFVDSLKTAMTRLQAGFVAIDPNNGHIKAWIGGRDFEQNKYDQVALSKRQPGSTFKPFVYAAALQKGYAPNDYLRDARFEYVDPASGQRWEPGNFSDESGELLELREGLAFSKNTITAQLIIDVGADRVADLANRMGIESELDPVPSLGLGTSVVTLLELVSAYIPFAAHGQHYEPRFVTRIENADGDVLATFEPESSQVLDPSVAYTVLDMMRGVVDQGTGVRVRSQYGARGDLAGKTGTTQHAADGWFVLMHPDLVMGSWIGFPSPAVTFRGTFWGQGARTALHVAGRFLRDVELPADARFTPPGGYAPPSGGGRVLVLTGDGTRNVHLAERAVTDRDRSGSREALERTREARGDTRDLNLAELDDLNAGTNDDRSREDGASRTGGSGNDTSSENRGRGTTGAGRSEEARGQKRQEAERDESSNRREPASETEQLNRQQREKSAVKDYLKQLRKEKGDNRR